MAGEEAHLAGLAGGEDMEAAVGLCSALGVAHERAGADLAVRGMRRAGRPVWRPAAAVEVGESGTLARAVTAVWALCGDPARAVAVRGRGTLGRRSSPALLECLRAAGAELSGAEGGGWPLTVRAVERVPPLRLIAPESSQEVSALLLALAGRDGAGSLEVRGPIPSRPYLAMTCAVLDAWGVRVEGERRGDRESFALRGPLRSPPAPVRIEADASAAGVALAAGCLSGGGVRAEGVGAASLQGDVAILRHLAAFGCEVGAGPDHLWARGLPSRGADCNLAGEPDLAPVLAAVAAGAAAAGHASRLEGLGTLDGKESARLRWLGTTLGELGFLVEVGDASLSLAGGGCEPRRGPTVLDPRGDHRMAFSGALLGLVAPEVRVGDPGCVRKSWPGFWEDLALLSTTGGARPSSERARFSPF
jgi:3-phosphoshikimate 1-carboxyvinyltransferase